MKQKIYYISIFLLFWFCGAAYPQNHKVDILQQDISGLFDNSSMIGILGEDCSRIDIHFTEVLKIDDREYEIKGVSRTRLSLICPFEGNIFIDTNNMLCDRSVYFITNNYVVIFLLRRFLSRRIMVKISLTTQDNGKPFPA